MSPETAAGLEAALGYSGGTHTLGDVCQAILAGEAQLHEAPGAAIVTEIKASPRSLEVNFWLATGELDAVIALSEKVMNEARAIGCTRAVFAGRRGWAKALAQEGWTLEPMVLMSRNL